MRLHNVPCTIIRCDHKSGTSKAGRPYSFHAMEIVDDEFNKFEVPVPDSVLVEGVVPQWLLEANKLKAEVDFEIVPNKQGFGVSLRATDLSVS